VSVVLFSSFLITVGLSTIGVSTSSSLTFRKLACSRQALYLAALTSAAIDWSPTVLYYQSQSSKTAFDVSLAFCSGILYS